MILKQCAACRAVVTYPATYCPACQAKKDAIRQAQQDQRDRRYDKARGSANARGYDETWRRARLMHMARHPLCCVCEAKGRAVPAVLVHHIRRLANGGQRLDAANLMSLCQQCHIDIHADDRWAKRDKTGRG